MPGEQRGSEPIRNPREQRVIELVSRGLTNSEVAREIGTTEYVIKNYLRTIYDKLGLWNRVELALWYEARMQEGRRVRAITGRATAVTPSLVRTSNVS